MSISRILAKEMAKSGGTAKLVKVPTDRRLTAESLRKLEKEISAQINSNEIMRSRSIYKAEQIFSR